MTSAANKQARTYNRTASPAIRGYKYQFDKTIIELIEANDQTIITIEGIEDYDRSGQGVSESVQVKYLEAGSFSLALIRDAIVPMLANSVINLDRRYKLYIYCGDLSSFTSKLDLEALKNCLSKKPRSQPLIELHKDYTDDQLSDFCIRLTLESGNSYDQQRRQAIDVLMREFNCSEDDCSDLFFPASRDVVSEIAIRTSLADRSLSKKEFLNKINRRHHMYTRWHAMHVGEMRFIGAMKRRVRAESATHPTRQRVVVVSHEDLIIEHIVNIAARLSDNYSRRSLETARPWTIVFDASASDVVALKGELLRSGLVISDGWEHILFRSDQFNTRPIVNTRGKSKIIDRSSYGLRIVSYETYMAYQGQVLKPDHVFSTGSRTIPGFEDRTFYLMNLPVERICEVIGV